MRAFLLALAFSLAACASVGDRSRHAEPFRLPRTIVEGGIADVAFRAAALGCELSDRRIVCTPQPGFRVTLFVVHDGESVFLEHLRCEVLGPDPQLVALGAVTEVGGIVIQASTDTPAIQNSGRRMERQGSSISQAAPLIWQQTAFTALDLVAVLAHGASATEGPIDL